MRKSLFLLVLVLNCITVSSQNCQIESALEQTFGKTHLNKWKIINKLNEEVQMDSFFLIEGKIGDSTYSNINNDVTVFSVSNYSILTEMNEGNIYLLPKIDAKKSKSSKLNLPDSISSLFESVHVFVLDSIDQGVYTTEYNGGIMKVKINVSNCMVQWLELTFVEEQIEGQDGFVFNKPIINTIRYELQSYESFPKRIHQYMDLNLSIGNVNNTWNLKPGFQDFQIINLIEETEF
jgi:hypothetical protein